MRLSLSIKYDVEDTTPESEEILEEIVGNEARAFAESVRRRLAEAGVRDLSMTLTESGD